jgi:hypothetical protein
MPVIGYANLLTPGATAANLAGFRRGLGEMGYVEDTRNPRRQQQSRGRQGF